MTRQRGTTAEAAPDGAVDEARNEIVRVGTSLFARGYVHAGAGNISAKVGDCHLITATDAALGFLEPDRLALVDAGGEQIAGDRASKTLTLESTGIEGNLAIGVLSAVPFLAALVTTNLFGRSADRRRERRWHLVVPSLMGAVGFSLAAGWAGSTALPLAALSFAAAGVLTLRAAVLVAAHRVPRRYGRRGRPRRDQLGGQPRRLRQPLHDRRAEGRHRLDVAADVRPGARPRRRCRRGAHHRQAGRQPLTGPVLVRRIPTQEPACRGSQRTCP
ncbi:class II aldolase/adducin family protein [Streptomyces sp. CA-251387]|uniref:class II aldolase/adducin family protein n=1 Tax=Streptomyces sp. CA-251387 TaxID=3240064 RepID=UPI003D92576A